MGWPSTDLVRRLTKANGGIQKERKAAEGRKQRKGTKVKGWGGDEGDARNKGRRSSGKYRARWSSVITGKSRVSFLLAALSRLDVLGGDRDFAVESSQLKNVFN